MAADIKLRRLDGNFSQVHLLARGWEGAMATSSRGSLKTGFPSGHRRQLLESQVPSTVKEGA